MKWVLQKKDVTRRVMTRTGFWLFWKTPSQVRHISGGRLGGSIPISPLRAKSCLFPFSATREHCVRGPGLFLFCSQDVPLIASLMTVAVPYSSSSIFVKTNISDTAISTSACTWWTRAWAAWHMGITDVSVALFLNSTLQLNRDNESDSRYMPVSLDFFFVDPMFFKPGKNEDL